MLKDGEKTLSNSSTTFITAASCLLGFTVCAHSCRPPNCPFCTVIKVPQKPSLRGQRNYIPALTLEAITTTHFLRNWLRAVVNRCWSTSLTLTEGIAEQMRSDWEKKTVRGHSEVKRRSFLRPNLVRSRVVLSGGDRKKKDQNS